MTRGQGHSAGSPLPCDTCPPPRTASTTRRVPSARSANLASLAMPPRAQPPPVTLVPVPTRSRLAGGCQPQGPAPDVTALASPSLSPTGSRSPAFWTRMARPPAMPAPLDTPAAAARGGWGLPPYNPPHLRPPHPSPTYHPPIPHPSTGAPRATRETPSSRVASAPRLVSGSAGWGGGSPHPWVPPTLTLAAHRPGARQV